MSNRLTSEVIQNAVAFINPLREREIDLRNRRITVIENLGATYDQFDTLDLSNNALTVLSGFPRLERVSTVNVSHNRIHRIDPVVSTSLPGLKRLVLTYNDLSSFATLEGLKAAAELESLSVIGNPACRDQGYRLYIVHLLPQLKVLDFSKVRRREREEAAKLFEGPAGRERLEAMAKGVEAGPREERASASAAQGSRRVVTKVELEARRKAIMATSSIEEADRLEREFKEGKFLTEPGEGEL
jgi:U2 small nuclear ribonucleoprotein A'